MSLIKEQTHEQMLNETLFENGCSFLQGYSYRVKRLACAYINIQQIQARLNYVESYQSNKLGEVHEIWVEHKTLLGKFRLFWFILIASIRDWNVKD